jgi:hypothetical protein
MQGETETRWLELCKRAAREQEPAKLLELTREISHLLEQKYYRLTLKRSFTQATD